jgi:hypothetical protein
MKLKTLKQVNRFNSVFSNKLYLAQVTNQVTCVYSSVTRLIGLGVCYVLITLFVGYFITLSLYLFSKFSIF